MGLLKRMIIRLAPLVRSIGQGFSRGNAAVPVEPSKTAANTILASAVPAAVSSEAGERKALQQTQHLLHTREGRREELAVLYAIERSLSKKKRTKEIAALRQAVLDRIASDATGKEYHRTLYLYGSAVNIAAKFDR